jgi:aryl-alcohol dehydrogenase-like predicted oxidoreductase
MAPRTIATTPIAVSALGFGTGSLHHLLADGDRARVLDTAAGCGITHFDTSPYYGYGLGEVDLGRFLRGRRSRFTVASKVGLYSFGPAERSGVGVWARKAIGRALPVVSAPRASFAVAEARRSLNQSLRRLQTDYLDFLFLHEPVFAAVADGELLAWMEAERAAGKVRAYGLAGPAERVAPFVAGGSPLAMVVQTQDSLAGREADFLLTAGRALQFTYGYLRRLPDHGEAQAASVAAILARNGTGTVLVSTRKADRLETLARHAGLSG